MRLLLTIIGTLSISFSALGAYTDTYSQVQLKEILKHSPRCELKATSETGTKVSFLQGVSESGTVVYFVELGNGQDEAVLLHLQKVGLIFGGYQLQASSISLVGPRASGNIILAGAYNDQGSDVSLDIKTNVLGKTIQYYGFCR